MKKVLFSCQIFMLLTCQLHAQAGFTFSGVDKPTNNKALYGLRYSDFVVPLVIAVQEQQAMIEEVKVENRKLKKENEQLQTSIHKQNASLQKLEALLLKN